MTEITKEKVFEIAAELECEGKKVSQRAVRAKLGGKGSFTTIGDYLNEYNDEKLLNESLKTIELPEKLAEKMRLTIAEFWQEANSVANIENEALKLSNIELHAQIEDMKFEHRAAISEMEDEQSVKEAAAAVTIADLEAKIADLEAKNAENEALIASQKEEIARIEGKNDLAEIKAIIEGLIADGKGKK